MPERDVTVYRFEQLWREDDRASFLIECSSGTYVRALIGDLGDAYCDELERTAIGPFRLEDAVGGPDSAAADPAIADIASALLPLRDALSFLPERPLSADEAAAVRNGRRVPAHRGVTGHLRLTRDGEVLAIGEVADGGEVQPVVVFAPA